MTRTCGKDEFPCVVMEDRVFALLLENLNPDPSSVTSSLYDLAYLTLVSLLNSKVRLGKFHLEGLSF